MFEKLTGTPKEKGTQVLIRDDLSFQIRKLDIEDDALVEKDNNHVVRRAWMMYYKLLKKFNGYKNVSADMVTISFGRDVVYDPLGQLEENEKPERGPELKKDSTSKIATSKCYKHEVYAKPSIFLDKTLGFMGTTMILLGIAIGLRAAFGGG